MLFDRRILVAVACIAFSGCASPYAQDGLTTKRTAMNSAAFSSGYSDGCMVANYSWSRQRQGYNKDSLGKDSNYHQGFMMGAQNCKDTVLMVNTGKPNDHVQNLW